MEVSHSLTLNETALQQLPDDKKPHFIFEWLRFLDKVLVAAHKSDIKSCQQKLVAQLVNLLRENLGSPARRLLARCLATLFSVGDTFLLFDTVNKCNDIIKVKDDSPSYLPTRLAAICCLGGMYEKLGRMMGRSYEETVTTLVRSLKSAESQTRLEIMNTLEKICVGMGLAAPAALREVSRAARAALLSDRAPAVRAAAANALRHMLPLMKLTAADLDAIAAACLRAAQPTDYLLRCAVSELLGALTAATQAGETSNLNSKLKVGAQAVQQSKKETPKNVVSLDEALNLLMGAFLRGGTSFLKGEIIKSGSGVSREVRVCVTHAYVIFVQNMGGVWLERNLTTFLTHVLDLVANPKAASSHVDAVYSRKCINYILRNTLGKMLGEKAQASACREIIQIVIKQMNSIDFNPENAKDCNQETLFSQHLLVCALMEAGELTLQLGTSVQNLVSDTSLNMVDAIFAVLEHPCVAARLAGAWCVRCICVALPSQITPLLDKCVDALDAPRSSPTPHHISGYSAALAAILGSVRLSPLGVPHGRGKVAFNAAEQLLRSAGQSSRLTAARTNAGWLIVGAICTLGVPVVRGLLPRMLLLWRNSFPRSAKEMESEKARGDAFTWQVTLEGRAGALSALHSLLIHCPSLVNNEDTAKRLTQPIDGAIAVLTKKSAWARCLPSSMLIHCPSLVNNEDTAKRLTQPIDGPIAVLTNVGGVVRNYGGSLKAPAALLRLRLYQACAALGPGAQPAAPLLRLLASELAGVADPGCANLATGMLRSAMHPRDTILLGDEGWIYDTDHAQIEEQAANARALHGMHQDVERRPPRGDTTVRAAAASCAGRLCGCVSEAESQAVSERALALTRAPARCARAAAAAAVAAVTRARGASAAAALPALRAMAQDAAGQEAQVWSLHALSVLADASGPMFRSHVDSTLNVALKLLFTAPPFQEDLHRAVGRLLAERVRRRRARGRHRLHATVADVLAAARQRACVGACAMFLSWLCGARPYAACASCRRRRRQRFAGVVITDTGLPGALFAFLDVERDETALSHARDTLTCCLLAAAAARSVRYWLALAKRVLTVRLAAAAARSVRYWLALAKRVLTVRLGHTNRSLDGERDGTALSHARDTLTCCLLAAAAARSVRYWLALAKRVLTVRLEDSNNPDIDFDGEGDDDQAEFHADTNESTHPAVQSRWPTRVSDYLSFHLSELVRMAFVGATAEADALRLRGLGTLQRIVGAALRPAFSGDTASHVTAAACDVCSAWIGCGVYIVAMVSNNSAPGSYIKQLDSKPINNRAEIAKWRNSLLRSNSQVEEVAADNDDEYGDFESKGENKTENTLDNRTTKTENGNFEFFEPVDERFHLLFGICMEALCAQRDMSVENTISVLLSIVTLLDAPENRARLLKDR
ncbi:hypothetical protein MSG28_011921 [Choristoneura fumiferana]|uniref:Uncharacterized protein n=1 Tax=Choristoneura fumiferana TaxID=7141 RepID=A0ACC0KMB6_CHOFU|nr:hypothetical protein MSG28_011921 [Choristoneura fumiferana]